MVETWCQIWFIGIIKSLHLCWRYKLCAAEQRRMLIFKNGTLYVPLTFKNDLLGGIKLYHQTWQGKQKNILKYFFFLKIVQTYMKEAECAETNENSIFGSLFFKLWSFLYSKHPNFHNNSKNKNLIQHIAHLSWKREQNWGWGVFISLVGKYPVWGAQPHTKKIRHFVCSKLSLDILSHK